MGRKLVTIGIDFDGVIHRYSKGWNGGSVYDPPMDGALEALEEIMREYPVFIFTARDPYQVKEAFRRWGVVNVLSEREPGRKFWNTRDLILVTNHKYPAQMYIDDRGYRFENWEDTLTALGLREPEKNYRTEPENRLAAAIEKLHFPRQGQNGHVWCQHCVDLSGKTDPGEIYKWPCATMKLVQREINELSGT